jgi:integrase
MLHRVIQFGGDSVATNLEKKEMPTLQLGRRNLSRLPTVSKSTVYYDTTLKGFGLRVSPTGESRWLIEYRPGVGGRGTSKRRMVIGSFGTLNPEEAREKAKNLLASVQLGHDPAQEKSKLRQAATIEELLAVYMREHILPKRKTRTADNFAFMINRYVLPELGSRRASELTKQEVAKWHREIGKSGIQVTANRVLVLLAAAFEFGKRAGCIAEDAKNPTLGIEKFRESARQRYLSTAEITQLGETLRQAESFGLPWEPKSSVKIKHAPKALNRIVVVDPLAVAAIRLLLFTGARLREILNLKWQHVDLQRGILNLPDSKTGQKIVLLGGPAIAIFESLLPLKSGEFIFVGGIHVGPDGRIIDARENNKPRADLNRPWARIRKHAKLEGFRLHDLRHSFASVGASSGLGLAIVGKLLGHKETSTTARYAHLADDPVRRAANAISNTLSISLGPSAK